MTASQATVLVMGGRNLAAKAQGKQGFGMDWETRRLTELSDDELLEIAKAEADEGVEGPQTKQDLEVIAILSATNTAVTVMVLGFLYIISRSRSGATLALKMMYPIETWSSLEPTSDFIRLLAVTLAAGLLAMPMMRYVGMGMLRLHAAIRFSKWSWASSCSWLRWFGCQPDLSVSASLSWVPSSDCCPHVSEYDVPTAWASSWYPS